MATIGALGLISLALEVSLSVGVGVGIGVPNSDGFDGQLVTYFVFLGVSLGVWIGVMRVLERSLQSGQAPLASKLILLALALTYAVLVWVYLLGG